MHLYMNNARTNTIIQICGCMQTCVHLERVYDVYGQEPWYG